MRVLKMRLLALLVIVFSVTERVVLASPVPEPNAEGPVVEEPQIAPEVLPAVIGESTNDEPTDSNSQSEEDSAKSFHHHHHGDHVEVQPIKAGLQPVEPIKAGLQPVEPIKAEVQPVEPIKSEYQPVEPIFPKSCTQPPLTGTCRGAFPMFYFDPETRTCKQFVYGGCRGNSNIHKTAADCFRKCYPEGLQTATVVSGRTSQNDYLTIRDGTGASILTFTGAEAAARVDPVVLGDFTISDVYAFEFHFRTDAPHGLIAFLRQVIVPGVPDGTRIQLYIYLNKGHLAVTHVLGDSTESFIMRKGGLQAGSWHSAFVQVDAKTGDLTMDVDSSKEYFNIKSLIQKPHYTGEQTSEGFTSLLWIGGVFEEELENEAMVHGFTPFHGCIQQMSLSSGASPQEMKRVQPFVATEHSGVQEHCADNCKNRYTNLCSPKSHCVEHFDHSTCNCFNSRQDGALCDNPAVPVLTLSGDGYVVHRLYEWMDRVHSYSNLISIGFKTLFADSILFYASAEDPERQYIAASITKNGQLYVEVNLGGGVANATFGKNVNSETWRKLTIRHQHEKILVYLDSILYANIIIPGNIRYFHLDPDVYIGNAPRLARECGLALDTGIEEANENASCSEAGQHYYYDKHSGYCHSFNYTGCGGNANRFPDDKSCRNTCSAPGLRSMNTFLGCLKWVFINDVSILQSLSEKQKSTRYHGSTKNVPLAETCQDKKFLPVTFSTERAAMKLFNPQPNNFQLTLSFKPTQPRGVLASGKAIVYDYESVSEWELRHDNSHVYFYLHDNLMTIKSDGKIKIGHWQYVEVRYTGGRINLSVNNKKQGTQGPGKLLFSPDVTIGCNMLEDFPGFIGCIRELHVGGTQLDLRTVVGTPMVNRDVTYDNCQVLSPCEGPRGCEHGGECSVDEEGEVHCDCSGTGYLGKECHFSVYKRSCEQYRQMGYNSSGIYRIDIDGNGPLPPSYVKCEFNELLQETYTIVEHNVENEYEVRKQGMSDFRMEVKYRDFTPEMLTYLISQSISCSQEVKYECRRSPLLLSTRTWFSSPSEKFISNYGTKAPGVCRCTELKSCDNANYPCNCDVNDGVPRRDIAIITNPNHLPIISSIFLQGNDQREDSEAFFTLKPLVCITQAVKEHTISFTNSASYLEVPAWREGSLLLTFRTTSKTAIIAFQPAHHPSHATLMISLVGDNELSFMYRYRTIVHQKIINTHYSLNNGQWQQILVDVYNQQIRFVMNSDERLIEVDPNVYLGVLDGSMYLGGIPEESQDVENIDGIPQLDGFIGCIKGLTINDEVVDMKKHLRASARGVVLGCNPSCDHNPCKNGAACIEKWGSYECQCTNPISQSGQNCENDLNDDAITFMTETAKYKYFSNTTEQQVEKILSESVLLNFRTHSTKGLLLFAYNHLHNFVQLHLARQDQLVFLFNHGNTIEKLEVTAKDGVTFNRGQSVQVQIERSDSTTVLTVHTEGHTFTTNHNVGLLLLTEDQYQQFPFEERESFPELVYYPHSMTKPTHFFLMYLGSASDKKHDIRSELLGIAGCIRGLKIGEEVSSLTKLLAQSPYNTDGAIANCKMVCDQKPCLNGGRCTEDFQHYSNFKCDCSGTSYFGTTCKSETGYNFYGNQWLAEDSSPSPLDSNFKIELAFSTSSRETESQIIALLRSTDPSKTHDYLLIWVDSDGSLTVEAQFQGADMVYGVTLSPEEDNFNAIDGFRHYIVVEKKSEHWTIKIDGVQHEKSALRSVYIPETKVKATPTALFLGGIEEELDDRLMHYVNFKGCISNVRISTHEGNSQPLKLYGEGDLHMKNQGLPGQGKCALFATVAPAHAILAIPETNNTGVIGSAWVYNQPQKMPYQAPAPMREEYERDTPFDNVVPIVAGTVIALALVIAVLLFFRERSKKKMQKKMNGKEEKRPLFNGRNTAPTYDERTKNLYIVNKDETVPLKSAPDGIQVCEKPKPKQSDEVPLAEIIIADKEPDTEKEDAPEAPEVVVSSEDTDNTGAVEVHKADAEEGEEVQVALQSPGVDSSSCSSLECTMEINPTPPLTPTDSSIPAPEEVDSASVEQPSNPTTSEGTPNVPDIDEQPADPEAMPVLKSYTIYGEDGTEVKTDFDKIPTIKIEKSIDEDEEVDVENDKPEEGNASIEPTADDQSQVTESVESDSKSSSEEDLATKESATEADTPVEDGQEQTSNTDVSESETLENDPQDSELKRTDVQEKESSPAEKDTTESTGLEIEEKEDDADNKEKSTSSSDSENDIEIREESTKVEVAQRMSKTVEELEVSSTNNLDSSDLDVNSEERKQQQTESNSAIAPREHDAKENSEIKDTWEQAQIATEKRHNEGDLTITTKSNLESKASPNENQNSKIEEVKTSSNADCYEGQYNVDITNDSTISEDLSFDQSIKSDDTDERDLSLLTQWSERQRSSSEGDVNKCRVSFNSDEGDSGANTYHCYINYDVDDDVLEDLTDPPHNIVPIHYIEEFAHLDTIQESGESEEEETDEENITMPSTMKSTLSAGMFNLQDISSDGADEPDAVMAETEDPENVNENSEKRIFVDLGGSSSSSSDSQSSDGEKDPSRENVSEKRKKKGRITSKKNVSPFFLPGNIRTFSNPISYLGGPTIEYDEGEGGSRSTNDSLTSTTSLD